MYAYQRSQKYFRLNKNNSIGHKTVTTLINIVLMPNSVWNDSKLRDLFFFQEFREQNMFVVEM